MRVTPPEFPNPHPHPHPGPDPNPNPGPNQVARFNLFELTNRTGRRTTI
jgi:hypothetical protein